MKRRTRTILLATLTVLALLAAAVGGTAYRLFFSHAFRQAETRYIHIRPGDTAADVIAMLEAEGAPSHALRGMRCLTAFYDYDRRVRSGRYAVRPGDTAFGLMRRLITGQQTPVRLVIPSVRTLDRLASAVSRRVMLDSATLARALTDSATCARLGYTPQTVAALFVPDTYEVYWDMSLDDFLARMRREHARFWNEERRARAGAVGLTPTEVATLASIVDEETAVEEEKPVVAGLYLNRLRRGMLLQADPTVKYAWGDFGLRRILHRHLTIDSPYNTYIYKGLPPGPIRVASRSGIEAVLNPARHDYLYMCAREDFSGRHNFASTPAEHRRNARRYQQELNRRRIY